MSDAFRLVGTLFIRSLPTVVFVIILLAILDRFFFRPIAEVTKKRAERTVGALDHARQQVSEAEAKSRQYEDAMRAARLEIFKRRQAEHQDALKEHHSALSAARERSELLAKEAQAELARETAAVEQQLAISCQRLAGEIMAKILGTDGGLRV